MPSRTVVARDFIEGRPLHRRMKVSDDFFPLLMELLAGIHARGVAYVDLEKPENILVGDDGRPYLIDFQVAFHVPRRFLGETSLARLVRRRLQQSDDYHAMKHFRRVRPDLLTAGQIARSRRKPWPVRAGNLLVAPWKTFRRRVLGK
jgi:RIO-like serine/threonine protein kinase